MESNVYISQSDIRENYLVPDLNDPDANHLGGGIYHKRGILSIIEGRISANDVGNTIPLNSSSWGGGIWYSSDEFPGSYIELNRSVISHNISTVWSAAMYLSFNVASAWTESKIEHCVIYGNHCISQFDEAAVSIFTSQVNPNFEGIINSVIRQNTFGPQNIICNRQLQMGSSDLAYPSLKHCVTHKFLVNGVETEYYGDGNLYIDPRFVDTGNGDFHLAWDEDGPSPCINAGYSGVDNEFTDPDGSVPDIGAFYLPHYYNEYFDRPSLISWLSFPVVDDRTCLEGTYWNELRYLFADHMELAPNSQLRQIEWSYDSQTPTMSYVNLGWQNSLARVSQPIGYKVQFNSGMALDALSVNGFKVDALDTPAVWVAEVTENGQIRTFDNWIGYYVTYTQKAGDAFSKYLPGSNRFTYLDHIYLIKTQDWSTHRLTQDYDSPWIIEPNTYTFSEGDMAVLQLLKHAPDEMYWSALTTPSQPIEKPPATAFTYEEKLDYTPVYIEFDTEDMPDEVGLFVNGECKGAAVVDKAIIDVCFYYEAAKDGGDLELIFYYEGKGKKAAKGWKLYNPDRLVFETRSLKVDQIGDYAYLSFKREEGDSPVPLVTALQPNYPNPFNPSTTMSFVLSDDMNARLEIYNVRGQKVKTLLNAKLGKGKHTLEWNGKDDNGCSVPSGIYFSRLSTADGSFVNKMMLMK